MSNCNNCSDNYCCGDCEPQNCLEQAINDALSTKEDQLQGYVDDAKQSADAAKASEDAAAESASNAKEYRDEAESAASTATGAMGIVVGVANDLQDTADILNNAVAGIAVSSWYYTTETEGQTVITVPPEKSAVDIQSIYIEGARQEPGRGFVFDKPSMTITLAEPLPLGLEIVIVMGTYNSDNPNDFAQTLASNNGASLVGTTSGKTVQQVLDTLEVIVESFGVISGIVTQAVAKANADKIMAKAAELSASGGAKLIFPKSLYQVHMDEADYDPAPATIRVAALKIPYDNITLVGQGWTSTTIQAYDARASYSVIQWSASPLENGVSKVTGVGLHHICIDGNYHGDYTPASYARQTAGVVGAGIIGLSISHLKIKNCSHYGLGLQNGGYKNCSIDGLWVESVGADGMDIKDNMSNSRAFHINNVIVSNFGQLDEPANPWAGIDVMSLAPKISNVYVSDFGDKGQPNNGVRVKQGLINDELGRGTGGVWTDITNITVVQNKSKVGTPSGSVGLNIRSPYVNYSNVVCMGFDGAILGTGIWIEERYCNGSNVQISKADVGYTTTGASGASERVYGDSQACSVTGITIVDTARALILNTKYQKVVNTVLKNCPIGVVVGGSIAGKITIRGIHLDGVADPFGQMGATYHSITDVTGPDSVNWQSNVGIIRGATDFVATTITSKNGIRLYSNTTDTAVGTELARFAPTISNIYAPLSVTGNVMPSAANTGFIGTSASSWAGGFTQTAFTVTSDERHKSGVTPFIQNDERMMHSISKAETDALMDAWAEVDFYMYQYVDRVSVKGEDGARWHFGAVAQRAIEALTRHGLEWDKYGFLCFDKWEYSPAEYDLESGKLTRAEVQAGEKYGIRYEEALVLEAALQRRERSKTEARLSKLESIILTK